MTDEDWKAWKLKRNKMEKEFVPYNLALRMKQLGFDEDCCKYVYVGDTGINVDHYLEVEPSKAKNYNKDGLCISQPLYQQAFRWFRKKYNLKSCIMFRTNMEDDKEYYDWLIKGQEVVYRHFNSYEEAELTCLEKLIEIVEQNKSE
jgi:hypothetical protein